MVYTNGNNIINGRTENDIIDGKDRADVLNGGAGNDILIGGLGADILTGDLGNDMFVYSNLQDSTTASCDTILDFMRGQDKIDLSQLNLNPADVHYHFEGAQTIIDTINSDFAIKLEGNISLQDSDFIWHS